jgi:hypothetical protein
MVKIDWSKPSLQLFVARRGSGKSVAMSYLYQHFKSKFNCVFVICPTEQTGTGFWAEQGVPKENIKYSYSDTWVLKLVEKLSEKNKGRNANNAFKTLLILDDCSNEGTKLHDLKSIKLIAGRGRHFYLTLIVSSQTLTSVPPTIRINSDAICVGRINRASLEWLEHENNISLPKKEFIKMIDNIPEYSFLVINNASSKSGSDLSDNYGVFKVPEDYKI